MKFNDLFKMAAGNLASRKLRTFLTVLGVIIGATAIIIIISIGRGFKYMNSKFYEDMGDMRILELNSPYMGFDPEMDKPGYQKPKKKPMNNQTIKEVSEIEHIKTVIPMYEGIVSLKMGREEASYVDIVGMPPQYMEDYGIELANGKYIAPGEKNPVVVIGSSVKYQFYDKSRPNYFSEKKSLMNRKIYITKFEPKASDEDGMSSMGTMEMGENQNNQSEGKQVQLRISGEMTEGNDYQKQNCLFMSVETYKALASQFKVKLKSKNYNNIKVVVDDIKNVDQVTKDLKDMGFRPYNMTKEFLDNANKQIGIVQAVFGGIGAISFIIAAIGIANTMIMSIYERTKEIGIMKVIGASIKDIQNLFLLEASLIGLIGGVIAVINSLIISVVANKVFYGYFMGQLGGEAINFEPKISIVSVGLILTALGFSTLIGLLSGYLPARRAMKLSALDAIRTE
ncbi:ABC transporter permease [Peptoniphilus sp.]|uniref:ABC transporter permease n=1 Tax=Peptoniphilus sp. TaxID=1971214 RepID=UPI003993C6DE